MKQRTLVILEVTHSKPIPALANMIAGRAYTIDGVTDAALVSSPSMTTDELRDAGFSVGEILLGVQEVHRT